MPERRFRINIGGLVYELIIEAARVPKDRWGDCSPPNAKRRRIRVSNRCTGTAFIDTLLHELIHARWWCLDESEVSEFATEVAEVFRVLKDLVIEALDDEEAD